MQAPFPRPAVPLPNPDIEEGTTTMDYLKQERERGITIRSAAISFNWKKCQINLIDTPGHVDFSGEVTRSLRVLDGAVTILDGSKGVESQTVKVWRQAERRSAPRICFVNKLDRIGSSVQRTAEAIQALLGV
jgi:elongation factor G